jgi:hypothetical protein
MAGIKIPDWLLPLIPVEGATVYAPCGVEIKPNPTKAEMPSGRDYSAQRKIILLSGAAIAAILLWRKFKK